MAMTASVDVDSTIKDMKRLGLNINKEMPKFIARLAFKGEEFMKNIAPYRTGTLRRSIGAYPQSKPISVLSNMSGMKSPGGVAIGVNYAFAANLRSRSPHYIERTVEHIEKIIPQESQIVINNALKKV